jgi:uncharacterized membrane protein HdeD (DUF308 family)
LLIDVVAFVGFLFLTSTGILLRYMLPPGSGRWADVWGLGRHDWGDVHFWVSLAFFFVLSLHLLLHWRTALALLRGRRHDGSNWRVILGVVGLVAVLLLAAAPLVSPTNVEGQPPGTRHGQQLR